MLRFLVFIIACIALRIVFYIIDYLRHPKYYKDLEIYRKATLDLVTRLEKVLEQVPKNTSLSHGYKPVADLVSALIFHLRPSRKKLESIGPIALFYENFGSLIENVRKYDGWSDKPLVNK